MRILGIDPGLTRCGVGVIEAGRTPRAVAYGVIRTDSQAPIEARLLAVANEIDTWLDEYSPDAVAVERAFAQHNVTTVMGVAQVAGLAIVAAARRQIPVAMHTPSEVKAAVTGYGNAPKAQVQHMVGRILGLEAIPQPADAADALALALTQQFRQGSPASAGSNAQTPAQRAWAEAERAARRSPGGRVPRNLR